MKLAIPTAVPATCPAWCAADHDDFGPAHRTDAPPVEVHELVNDKHTAFCVELIQPEDGKHHVSLTAEFFDVALPADDARRFALAILAQLDVIESAR